MKILVACPFCDHEVEVRAQVSPKVMFGWSHSVLFMTAEWGGASGIEHHCDALKELTKSKFEARNLKSDTSNASGVTDGRP